MCIFEYCVFEYLYVVLCTCVLCTLYNHAHTEVHEDPLVGSYSLLNYPTPLPGMRVLHKTFPNGMLTGVVPKSCLPSPPSSARKGSGKRSVPPPTSVPGPVSHRETFTDDGEHERVCNAMYVYCVICHVTVM